MSMLYDPVTRQFRPRDLQVKLPKRADGDRPAVTPPSAEALARRSRRWQSIRHRYRRREMAFWLLTLLVVAVFIVCTLLIFQRMHPRTGLNIDSDKSIIDRSMRSLPDL